MRRSSLAALLWLGFIGCMGSGSAYGAIDGALQILQVPTSVKAGERFNATFRLINTGNAPIQAGGTTPTRLGSWTPENNQTWGTGRVSLPADIAPGQSLDVTEVFVAPAKTGTQTFSWRCVVEHITWFCATATVSIDVLPGPAGVSVAAAAPGPALPPPSTTPAAPSLPPASAALPRVNMPQPVPEGVTMLPMPPARADGSLVSAGIIDTGPYTGDSTMREAVWVNKSGRELEIHQVYLWAGVDIGARADVHAEVRRSSDDSILAILQWDRYAEPSAPDNHAVFRYQAPYMRIAQGDAIKLRYRMVPFNGNQYRAHNYVIIWAR